MRKHLLFLILMSMSLTSFAQVTTDGLIATYLLNGNVKDDSGLNNNGRIHGACAYSIDRFGNDCGAMRFNGSNGYVSVPNSISLSSPKKNLTLSIWFKTTQGQKNFKWITALCKGNSRKEKANSPHYRLQITSKTLSVNTEFTEKKTIKFVDNRWYHYVMTYDGQKVKTYLDGELVFNYPFTRTLFSNKGPLLIGRDAPGTDEYFNGALDEIRIYNRALNQREITELYLDESEFESQKDCPEDQESVDIKKDKNSKPMHIIP